jgi:uncharacterized protein YjeT (DUF2065 family)
MSIILAALGLAMCLEGLVFALAPTRLEDILRRLAEMPVDVRRLLGLLTLVLGVALLTVSRFV